MLNDLFSSVLSTGTASSFSVEGFFICTAASLVLGMIIAVLYMFRSTYSKSFVVTLALLPAIVQLVIMLVNGNLGTGVAVMGAFSLVRFRSVPGSAKEIASIFLAMAVGLATGMGYLAAAAVFVVILGCVNLIFSLTSFGDGAKGMKVLRITIPESLDYSGVFDDLFEQYTSSCRLVQVRTCNMGSLYKLTYQIVLRDPMCEKELIAALRCRNGNLEIFCGQPAFGKEEL